MKRFRKRKLNNKGFTLVELIVAMLISSIVMLAAAGFMSTGTSLFKKNNNEVNLQMEADTAVNFISDVLKESKDYTYYPSIYAGGSWYRLLCVQAVDNNIDYLYFIILNINENMLCFEKIEDDGSFTGEAQDLMDICSNSGLNDYLAQYIADFSITPDSHQSAKEQNSTITITVKSENGESEYESKTLVSSRNN